MAVSGNLKCCVVKVNIHTSFVFTLNKTYVSTSVAKYVRSLGWLASSLQNSWYRLCPRACVLADVALTVAFSHKDLQVEKISRRQICSRISELFFSFCKKRFFE